MKWHFRGHNGDVIVTAKTEQEARDQAMYELWGPPQYAWDKRPYRGVGLDLIAQMKEPKK